MASGNAGIKRMRNKTSIIFLFLGAVLIISACALCAYYTYEDHQAKVNAALILKVVEHPLEEKVQEEEQLVIQVEDFEAEVIGILTIEKLSIHLPVLSEYTTGNLKFSVCCYERDYFAKSGRMVIAGHNYKSHFGRLSQMTNGDIVIFTDIHGNESQYYVTEIIEIDGEDAGALDEGDWTLSLFTCAFDRTKRIVIRCKEA